MRPFVRDKTEFTGLYGTAAACIIEKNEWEKAHPAGGARGLRRPGVSVRKKEREDLYGIWQRLDGALPLREGAGR